MKKRKPRFNLYQYQGLPVAALALVVLLLFLLVAARMTQLQEQKAEEEVQGVSIQRAIPHPQKEPVGDAAMIDNAIHKIDAVVNNPNAPNGSDLPALAQ